jgi:PAS domain-containing protein
MLDVEEIKNYHKIFDQTPIAFTVVETLKDERGEPYDFVFRYVNDACAALAGLTGPEMVDGAFRELFPEANDKWLMYIGETACRGRRNVFTDDGGRNGKYLRAECYRIADDVCGCVLTDLSEEMKIRRALQTEQESFKAAISCTGLHHWEYDEINDLAIQSDKCVRDLHVPKVMKDYPRSWLDTNILLPQYWNRYLEIHRELKQGALEVSMEHQIWPPDAKEPRWERIIYKNIFDESGRPVRAIGTAIDITEEKRLKYAYDEFIEYQGLMAANTFDAYKLNVTKDTIVAVKNNVIIIDNNNNKLTMTDFFKESRSRVCDPEENQQYAEIFDRAKMLKRFSGGERTSELVCRYRIGDGLQYLKLSLSMARHPITKDVLAFTWAEDVTEKKLDEAAIQSVVDHDYEIMFRIDGNTRHYVAFLHAKTAKNLPALSGDDFDIENEKFANEHLSDPQQRRERIRALSVENMIRQLDENGSYHCYYDLEENGTLRRKELQCYYIDKKSHLICAARTDVTEATQAGRGQA